MMIDQGGPPLPVGAPNTLTTSAGSGPYRLWIRCRAMLPIFATKPQQGTHDRHTT